MRSSTTPSSIYRTTGSYDHPIGEPGSTRSNRRSRHQELGSPVILVHPTGGLTSDSKAGPRVDGDGSDAEETGGGDVEEKTGVSVFRGGPWGPTGSGVGRPGTPE